MAALTQGMFTAPITITGGSAQITVTYDDLTTQDVTLDAGTYYPQGNGSASDFLQELEDQLNTWATDGDTWTVEATSTGLRYRCKITAVGGKTVSKITFNTEIDNNTLGFLTTEPAFTLGVATGTHRMAHVWLPEEETFLDETEPNPECIQALTASTGVTDFYDRMAPRILAWPEVWGALVLSQYTADSAHAANAHDNLATTDPNASLEAWLGQVRAEGNGDSPLVRWCPDLSSPGTYTSCILPAEGYTTRGWVQFKNDGPLWYSLGIEVLVPVS